MKRSIARKISVLLLIVLALSTAVIGVYSYYLYRKDSINFNAERALAIAESVAAATDGDQMAAILASGEKDAYYSGYQATVDSVKARTGVTFLYVMDSNYSSDVRYFAEGSIVNDEDIFDLGGTDEASAYADEMFDTINTGVSSVTGIYISGDYGTMVSGFAPIKDSGNRVVGVVGVDLIVEGVLASSYAFGLKIALIVIGFCIVFGLLSFWAIDRLIGKPIGVLTAASGKIAVGDLDIHLDISSEDEIGRLADSFAGMVTSTQKQVDILERLSDGDLTMEVAPRSANDSMSLSMKKTIDNLNAMFSEIYRSTAQVSQGAAQIADGAQNLSMGTTEQAESMERLVNSMSRVEEKTRENTAIAEEATTLAVTIKANAEKGSQQMDTMLRAVNEIDDANKSISKVIKVIDDIAFQTNILALNAAVEAARAGQHGKGFAVVADEVRNLAAKSAASAKDTSVLIANSVEKAALGVSIARETATSLGEIVSGINESNRIVSGIAVSSEEQSASIVEINENICAVAEVVQHNSATAEESAAASEEMSTQAATLEFLLSRFRIKQETSTGMALENNWDQRYSS